MLYLVQPINNRFVSQKASISQVTVSSLPQNNCYFHMKFFMLIPPFIMYIMLLPPQMKAVSMLSGSTTILRCMVEFEVQILDSSNAFRKGSPSRLSRLMRDGPRQKLHDFVFVSCHRAC